MSRGRALALGWLLALLACALFVRLGFWQSGRALEKEATLAAVASVLDRSQPVGLERATDASRARGYDWAVGTGRFTGDVLLLDNQQRDGRVGVRAYAPFEPQQGGMLLVDLGWLPLEGNRRLPEVSVPAGMVEVQGLLAPPPSAGLALGPAMAREQERWLMLRIDRGDIQRALGLARPPAPRVLRLDPALPFGHARDLELLANTLPPDKHRGYALQWFGLAATVLVIAVVLTFRRKRQ